MALADIVLADSQPTPVNHTFSYVGTDQSGRVVRRNLARTPDLPETLTIGHKVQKVNGINVDSHVWRIDDSVLDADGVTVRKLNLRVMLDCDPAIYSDAKMEDLAAMMTAAFTETFMKSWSRGSVG